MDSQQRGSEKKPRLKPPDQFSKYTGLGFQWLFTFGLMGYLGYLLDEWLGTLPVFMMVFVLVALVGNIYLVIRSGKGS